MLPSQRIQELVQDEQLKAPTGAPLWWRIRAHERFLDEFSKTPMMYVESPQPQCSNLSCGCKVSSCCGRKPMDFPAGPICPECNEDFTPAPCTVGEKKKRENRFFHCPKCSLKEYKYVDSVVGLKRCPFCKEDTMHSEKDWGSGCNKQEVPPSENTVEEWNDELKCFWESGNRSYLIEWEYFIDRLIKNAVSTAEKETKRKIRKNFGALRQWLNELPTSFGPVSNEDIILWLELQD